LGKYKHRGVLPEGEIVTPLMGACASNGLLKEDGQHVSACKPSTAGSKAQKVMRRLICRIGRAE
jgi:hypothetical protein